MNDNLQNSLARFVDNASNIAYEQAPEAIHQMVTWHLLQHSIGLLLCSVAIFFIGRFFYKNFDSLYRSRYNKHLKNENRTSDLPFTSNLFERVRQINKISGSTEDVGWHVFCTVSILLLPSVFFIYNATIITKIILFPNWYVVGEAMRLIQG